ncbi:MAG: Neutral/alkaline nonlysosomal ceramidase [Monoraphidium minutum]|nr:MAG: Neutral/alkaline nonlysosomal ceramidase [Monoraphidium minutum]
MTGPCAEVNLMGYSMPDQVAKGLHTRLFARTFIFADPKNATSRVAFVTMDAGMASQLLTMRAEYSGLYTRHNVALSGTHTHAGPGGYLQYLTYSLSALGFVEATFDAMLEGVLESIRLAHADLRPGRVSLAEGELLGASINRRGGGHGATMTLLRVTDAGGDGAAGYAAASDGAAAGRAPAAGRGRGLLSWFAVHPVSMNNTNPYVSGDNKGAAEQFTEKWAAAEGRAGPGFVAAFAQNNGADTTPNTRGASCLDTGQPCDALHSTCGTKLSAKGFGAANWMCWGKGPAWPNDMESCRITGQLQADKAIELWSAPGTPISGPISGRHVWVDMGATEVKASKHTRPGRTCPGAMGFAFAAGTTDGPGGLFFEQGDTNGTAFWRLVRNALRRPSKEQEACHLPKPILLDAGEMSTPYPWVPRVLDVSLLRIGNLAIACLPGEVTTMAGRRIVRAVEDAAGAAWGPGLRVVVAGLCGTYSSYITTQEEYAVQRYEGGFTLFGPHTLDAYIQTLTGARSRPRPRPLPRHACLAKDIIAGAPIPPPAVTPPDLSSRQISLLPPVVPDMVPLSTNFGDVVADVAGAYRPGQTVEVTFRAGNPRNDVRRGGTFLSVQRLAAGAPAGANGSSGGGGGGGGAGEAWVDVFSDDDWSTRFLWEKHSQLSTHSFATVMWEIPAGMPGGTYRIKHFGARKAAWGGVRQYEGTSGQFVVARDESTYKDLSGRFTALSKALGSFRAAAGAFEFELATAASSRAREPTVLYKGVVLPLALSLPPAPKWWRGEGGGGACGRAGCAQEGGAKARGVHARCPEWWRPGGTVKCSGVAWGSSDVKVEGSSG